MTPGRAAELPIASLADALWMAREQRVPLADLHPWRKLDHDTAAAISDDLYRRAGVAAAAEDVSAWKLGALDEPTQQRLGLLEPLVAPVLPAGLHTDVTELTLSLADLVAPKLEAEVGILVDDSGPRLVPCVEIADCRFPAWSVPPACAIADFGLQGCMAFGTAVQPRARVHVVVRHDGEAVGEGTGEWDDVLDRLAMLPTLSRSILHVATGSITPMFPAEPGTWEFDFGDAGRIVLVMG